MRIAYLEGWPTPSLLARGDGRYDARLGVPVQWRGFRNGAAMSEAMAAGEIDIAYSQGVVPFLLAVTEGLPVEMVGIAVSYPGASDCILQGGGGIDRETATALEGRQIAAPVGNLTHFKLLRMLEHLGVDASRIALAAIEGDEAVAALARGDVAMACGHGAALARLRSLGAPLMSAAEQEAIGIRVFDVIAVRRAFALEEAALLQAFLDVTDAVNRAYTADPAQFRLRIAAAAGMRPDEAERLLELFAFPSRLEQAGPGWMGGRVQGLLKELADFFVAAGQMERAAEDYRSAVNPAFLR
ncbi:MAG: ABC transporter substrate-binding protein [Pseudomonadota bacterium]